MNYIVVSLLCDQFDQLDKEFDKCIGDRGEFGGNFEQFRRRHQAISRSVQEADRFLTFSNAAGFCSLIISIILVLYSSLFTRGYTFSLTTDGAVLYFFWLAANLFGISLAVGLAIFVNRKVSKVYRVADCIYLLTFQSIFHHQCPSYLSDLVQFITADSSRSRLRSSQHWSFYHIGPSTDEN